MINYKYEDGLESDRLRTRLLVMEDYKAWTGFLADKESAEFLPNLFNEEPEGRAIRWMNKIQTRYREKTFGLQALIHKQTGEFIGQCGLLGQEVDGVKEVEVGYHIFRQHWGKGYAPEAARLFMKYGFENALTESIISIIHVDNIKSQRVALKNGLKREKVTRWNEKNVAIYRIHASEFLNKT